MDSWTRLEFEVRCEDGAGVMLMIVASEWV